MTETKVSEEKVREFMASLPPDAALTMAVVGALAKGDFENARVAAVPGGIEAQERQGQADMCKKHQLPVRYGHWELPKGAGKAVLMEAGVKFGKVVDDLFQEVELPKGWRLEPTDHAMHSNLVDSKDRIRATIFYKAAFYDRRADMHVQPRYSLRVLTPDGYDAQGPVIGCVYDGGVREIWKAKPFTHSDEWQKFRLAGWDDTLSHEERERIRRGDAEPKARKAAEDHLDERYPDWRDLGAYWD